MNPRVFFGHALVLLALPLAQADGQESNSVRYNAEVSPAAAEHRHREGTRMVEQIGYFKTTGDRLVFHVAGTEEKYLGLENLAMERIAKVVSARHDHAEKLLWEVTGVFTEFRGANYLLVTHAILQSKRKARPPAAAG